MEIEEVIFNLYKDKVVVIKRFREEMEKKYKLSHDEIRNLYVRINNYQIEHYGDRLLKHFDIKSREEFARNNKRASQIKYYKRNYEKK